MCSTWAANADGGSGPIQASLTDISRRLDKIEESYANLKGVTKEIDEILREVRVIEKHLGIEEDRVTVREHG